ncbi:MAG: glycolate oxidase subunit GlcF [Rhodospirillales bacterium]|nr:glycolate oxidase subunit GlcF [Rhodospirillales bacterium]
MQTNFTLAQLADPDIEVANGILRKCVHCGFCTATCPTYVTLGDELDSPRGRIYLIKDMLEGDKPATEKVVTHVDRCLSCLSCMTTCPASVDYMHLVDLARVRIEKTFQRPLTDRLFRRLLAFVLPYPGRFRLALMGAWFAKPLARILPRQIGAMLVLAPASVSSPSAVDRPQVLASEATKKMRVALLTGCAQQVLNPVINEATTRLLRRHGCEVVIADGMGCCGALVHHMGREGEAHAQAKANIVAWERVRDTGGLDAIVINASGCGTTVKDYGYMLRNDPAWAERAATISSLTRDVTEVMVTLGLDARRQETAQVRVAYHSACSMQHGQKLKTQPLDLLRTAGFQVLEPQEGHLCCGSAGTYNIMQPDLATQLRDRKVANLKKLKADVVAAGNIGCQMQIAAGIGADGGLPVVHTVELLDWASGGPKPAALAEPGNSL